MAKVPEKTKESLEIDKLDAEIKNLRSRWWCPAAIQATPGLLLVVATVCVALYTGVLDAKRDRIGMENERLAMEKLSLEAKKKEGTAELKVLEAELQVTKSNLAQFQNERELVRSIRSVKRVSSNIEFLEDNDEYRVKFSKNDAGIKFPGEDFDSPFKVALERTSRLPKLKRLGIVDIPLEDVDLQTLNGMSSLYSLTVTNSALNDEKMQKFPVLNDLSILFMSHQPFSDPGSLRKYQSIFVLSITDTPLSDEGLLNINCIRTSVGVLHLNNTNVSDAVAFFLAAAPRLQGVNVSGTKMTVSGIRTLATSQSLTSIMGHKGQIDDAEIAEIQKVRPKLKIELGDSSLTSDTPD